MPSLTVQYLFRQTYRLQGGETILSTPRGRRRAECLQWRGRSA